MIATQKGMNNDIGIGLDVSSGYNPIPLYNLRNLFNSLPRGDMIRVFLLLAFNTGGRPTAISKIKGYNITGDIIIYRETKTSTTRKIKLTPMILKEVKEYMYNNDIINRPLFPVKYKRIQRRFNDEIRPLLNEDWNEWDNNFINRGIVKKRRRYTIRSLRTTISTLVYYYYLKLYGSDVALSRACSWLGHRSTHITADYYIKNLDSIGIESYPKLPLPKLIDYIIYNSYQKHIIEYNRQSVILEY